MFLYHRDAENNSLSIFSILQT